MQHRKHVVLLTTGLLTLAACGPGDDAGTDATNPPATAAPEVDDSSDADSTQESTEDGSAPTEDSTPAPTPEAVATDAPAATGTPTATEGEQPAVTEPAVTEPVATDAAVPAEPVLGGRLFASEVQPAADFDGNPFPDLVVDDIGKDAQVNIKNILPSDRPVLLWAWAPH